ncbi:MAG: hydantoinase B/oxoprolinase family protein [Deltaproteobacteria bacterium]|nr:hydantoinase B/oxoprolinase family protein [Deltaproteobacteria bacterium]
MKSRVDPATLEIVRGALVATANEMAMVLSRTAYNTMIFEVQDYCIGIIDPAGRLIAQNSGGLPIFLADMGVAVMDGIEKYGLSGFEPGDAIIMNAPYVCGQHLNNVVVYSPCFVGERLVAFPAVRAHWLDIGGSRVGFGSVETTEIYQEGLQLRSIKIYRGGELDENIWQIISDNIRFPESSLGDLRAQLAACRLGERRLKELFERYGVDTVNTCIEEMWDQSERLARAAVTAMPDAEYAAESFLDNDGQELEKPVRVKVTVRVRGEEMEVDFSEVAEQVRGPINCGPSGGIAAARVAFKALTLPSHPVDEGCFRPLKVILPPGKFLSAGPPAPLGLWSIPLPTVIDTVLAALAPAVPQRIPAAHKGEMGGFAIYGSDGASGRRYVCLNMTGGGWGGRPSGDGPNGAVSICQGDVRNTPIELLEARYPLFFEYFSLRADSGGAGRSRGGLGIEVAVRPKYPAAVNFNLERTKCPPWGLWGGKPATVGEAVVEHGSSTPGEHVTKRTRYPIFPEDRVIFRTAGGGGWGDPLERDPAAVAADIREGYISITAAADYGVVLDAATGEADLKATEALRQRLREERKSQVGVK